MPNAMLFWKETLRDHLIAIAAATKIGLLVAKTNKIKVLAFSILPWYTPRAAEPNP